MTDNDVRSVTVEREIPHPPEKIWRALTTQHLIEEWLMKNDFGLDLGHRFQLRGDWGHVDCEILDVEPGRTLSYAWNTAHDDPAYALDSVRSEEHTSELQSLMRISYAVFCLKKQKYIHTLQTARDRQPE